MPICQKCEEKWNWIQTIKTLFRLKCPYCKQKQYESASSRVRSGMVTLTFLVVILPLNSLLDVSFGMGLVIGIIMVILILALYPFILTLSNEEEPYW
ncbi:TIGR04104 family putative zinc finger protein [Ornithinibacillus scapharcae]|uniref:TIGR04104 family putative zinc finger protein n=1 Tax=Ornithinibacillus scapharcae TaxID=1147159 RepID=UPI000225B004|nr:TIGR04104 family putative zinc finger protein [Ornithinibacillus scapharcae]